MLIFQIIDKLVEQELFSNKEIVEGIVDEARKNTCSIYKMYGRRHLENEIKI